MSFQKLERSTRDFDKRKQQMFGVAVAVIKPCKYFTIRKRKFKFLKCSNKFACSNVYYKHFLSMYSKFFIYVFKSIVGFIIGSNF